MTRHDIGPGGTALPRLSAHAWLASAETQSVLRCLREAGHEGRVVGGAVRNALLGEPVKDIDIATAAMPAVVMDIAQRAGLKAVPTGIEHGTVTVVVNHVPFEVTTLRRDIETFGRHARVTFTADWAEDARRRDFTINALYCDADGHLHDPLGGYADIVERRVRFIGDPHDRIREDYLRILRFYRFTAEYTGGAPDAKGHAASLELADGLSGLSAERIRGEVLRLLVAPAGVVTVDVMERSGLLARVIPGARDTAAFARLAEIESATARAPDAIVRLAALTAVAPGTALVLRDRLRLSAAEYERLARMAIADAAFDPATAEIEGRVFLYRHGVEAFTDGALLAWARSGAPASDTAHRNRLMLPARWQAPQFPVRGADVLALGVPAGRLVGQILARLEEWWIGEGFTDDAHRLAAELHRLAKVTKP